MAATAAFLLAILICSANAGPLMHNQALNNDNNNNKQLSLPLDNGNCATECKAGQAGKFAFLPGTTYTYRYTALTDTAVAGASTDAARLHIQADAEITVLTPCEFSLSLTGVKVSHSESESRDLKLSEKNAEFRALLESSPLRFGYSDGVVTSLCPAHGDQAWAVNVKRGVLSALQASLPDYADATVTETDVVGQCETKYTVTRDSWGNPVLLTKTKELLGCRERAAYHSLVQAVPYTLPSDIQNLPLVKGSYECRLNVGNRIIKDVQCVETQVFVPFSNQQSGGRTAVTQTLTYLGAAPATPRIEAPVSSRASLLFSHVANLATPQPTLYATLTQLCLDTQHDIRPATPRQFGELVSAVRALDLPTLQQTLKDLNDLTLCPVNSLRGKTYFLDALPAAGTEAAVRMMVTLLSQQEVSSVTAALWLTNLATLSTPTEGMVEAATSLLAGPWSREARLPVSALAGRLPAASPALPALVAALARPLAPACAVTDATVHDVLLSLRALGNLGGAGVAAVLTPCLLAADAPLEVKVAAASALRRLPCPEGDDTQDALLWTTLRDVSQDAELRVTAYLATMRCPTLETLKQMESLVNSAPEADPLAAYAHAHLTALAASSDPLKQEVAGLAASLSLKAMERSLPTHLEKSVLVDKLNVGGVLEADVITVDHAPRAASLNLTTFLFGQAVNVLEIGGRVENVADVYQMFFDSEKKPHAGLDQLKGSLYTRVFGQETTFHRATYTQVMEAASKLPELLTGASLSRATTLTHNMPLLNARMSLPTIAGLPLDIAVNGSATVDLVYDGKVDASKFSLSPLSFDLEGEIRPSMALEVTGGMTIDGLLVQVGQRMRNTLHSSTAAKGKLRLRKQREFEFELEPPTDRKMEIFSAKSQFFIKHNNVETEQKMIIDNYKKFEGCTGKLGHRLFGAQLCGSLMFPNASAHAAAPYFPLTGPASMALSLAVTDTQRKIRVHVKKTDTRDASRLEILYNTPGSQINRLWRADATLRRSPSRELALDLQSPFGRVAMDVELVMNRNLKSLTGSLTLNEKDVYGLVGEVGVSRQGRVTVLRPRLAATSKGNNLEMIGGQVQIGRKQYSVEMDLAFPLYNTQPVKIEGELSHKDTHKRLMVAYTRGVDKKYVFDLEALLDVYGKNIKVIPKLVLATPTRTLAKLDARYESRAARLAKGELTLNVLKWRPATMWFKVSKGNNPKGLVYRADASVKTALASGGLGASLTTRGDMGLAKVKVNYNIPKVAKNQLTLNARLTDRSSKWHTNKAIKGVLQNRRNPEYNLNIMGNLDYKKKKIALDGTIKFGQDQTNKLKPHVVSVKAALNTPPHGEQLAALALRVPSKNIDIDVETKGKLTKKEISTTMTLRAEPFINYDVTATFNGKNRSNKNLHLVAKSTITLDKAHSFKIDTQLLQRSQALFLHSLTMEIPTGKEINMETAYRAPTSTKHALTSLIKIDNFEPFNVTSKLNLDPCNLLVYARITGNELDHGFETSTKVPKSNEAAKWKLDIDLLSRKIIASAGVSKKGDKYHGDAMINFDARKKLTKNSLISFEGNMKFSTSDEKTIFNTEIEMQSPFKNFEYIGTSYKFNVDPTQYNVNSRMSWQRKNHKITSNMLVKRPFNPLTHAHVSFDTQTPWKAYREIGFDIDHDIDTHLVTAVKGFLENNKAVFNMDAEKMKDGELKGSIDIKTPYPAVRDFQMTLSNVAGKGKWYTTAEAQLNGQKYDAEFDINHATTQLDGTYEATFSGGYPYDRVTAKWTHKNAALNMIKDSLEVRLQSGKFFINELEMQQDVKGFDADLVGKWSFTWPRDTITAQWAHKNTGFSFIKNSLEAKRLSGTQMRGEFEMKNIVNGQDIDNSGKLIIYWPELNVNHDTTWKHKNTGFKSIESQISARNILTGDQTNAYITMTQDIDGLNIENAGKITLNSWMIENKHTLSWSHKNTCYNKIKTSFESDISGRKYVNFDFDVEQEIKGMDVDHQGKFTIKLPEQNIDHIAVWKHKNDGFNFIENELVVKNKVTGDFLKTGFAVTQAIEAMNVELNGKWTIDSSWLIQDQYAMTWYFKNIGFDNIKSALNGKSKSGKYISFDFNMNQIIHFIDAHHEGKWMLKWPGNKIDHEVTWEFENTAFELIKIEFDAKNKMTGHDKNFLITMTTTTYAEFDFENSLEVTFKTAEDSSTLTWLLRRKRYEIMHFELEGQKHQGKYLSLNFDVKQNIEGISVDHQGSLSMVIPTQNVKTMASWKHKNSGFSIFRNELDLKNVVTGKFLKTLFSIKQNGELMNAEHKGKWIMETHDEKTTASWTLKNEEYKSIKLSFDASQLNQKRQLKIDFEINKQSGQEKCTHEAKLTVLVVDAVKFEMSNMWKINHNGFKLIDIDSDAILKYTDENTNEKEFSAKIALEHQVKGMKIDHSGLVTFTWPDDTLNTKWSFNRKGLRTIETFFDSKFKSSETYFLSAKLLGKYIKNNNKLHYEGEIDLLSQFKPLSRFHIEAGHEMSKGKLASKFDLMLNDNPKTHADYIIDLDDNKKEFSAKLMTPFPSLKKIVFSGSHQIKEGEEHVTDASLVHNFKNRATLKQTLKLGAFSKAFDCKIDTSFKSFEHMDAGFHFNMAPRSVRGEVHIEAKPVVERIEATFDLNNAESDAHAEIKFALPNSGLTYFAAVQNPHEIGRAAIELQLKPFGAWPQDKMITASVNFNELSSYQIDAVLNVPERYTNNVNKFGAFFVNNPKPFGTKMNTRFFANEKEIEMNYEHFVKYGEKINIILNLNTPLKGFKRNVFSFVHDGSVTDGITKFSTKIGKSFFDTDMSFSSKPALKEANVKLSTMFIENGEEFEGSFIIKGDIFDMNGKLELLTEKDTYRSSFTNVFKNYQSMTMKSTFVLVTPFTEDLNIDFNLKNNGILADFDSTLVANYGNVPYFNQATFKRNGKKNLIMKVVVNTPFENVDDIKVNTEIKTNIENFKELFDTSNAQWEASSLLEINTQDMLNFKVSLTTDETKGLHGEVRLGGDAMQGMALTVDHAGTIADFRTLVAIDSENIKLLDTELFVKILEKYTDIHGKIEYTTANKEVQKIVFETLKKGSVLDMFDIDMKFLMINGIQGAQLEELSKRGVVLKYNIINKSESKYTYDAKFEMFGLRSTDDVISFTNGASFSEPYYRLSAFEAAFCFEKDECIEMKYDEQEDKMYHYEIKTPFENMTFYSLEVMKINEHVAEVRLNVNFKSYIALFQRPSPTQEYFKVNIKTPIKDYENMEFVFKSTEDTKDLFIEIKLREDFTFVVSITPEDKDDNPKHDFALKIKTPLNGYENMALTFNSLGKSNVIIQYVINDKVVYELRGQSLRDKNVFKYNVEIDTPITNYEKIGFVSTCYDEENHDGCTLKLQLRNDMVFTYEYKTSPAKTVKFTTPFGGLQEFALTVQGFQWEETNPDVIDGSFDFSIVSGGQPISGRVELRYLGVHDLLVSARLAAGLASPLALRLLAAPDTPLGQRASLQAAYGDDEVKVESSLLSRRERGVKAALHMTFPSELLRSLKVGMDQRLQPNNNKLSNNMFLTIDEEPLLDLQYEADASNAAEQTRSVTFTKPWAMYYLVTHQRRPGLARDSLKLSWDSTSDSSDLVLEREIKTNTDDQMTSTYGLKHNDRMLNFEHIYRNVPDFFYSKGTLSWAAQPEGNSVFYLLSRRPAAATKAHHEGVATRLEAELGTPTRHLAAMATALSTPTQRSVSGSLAWDQSRDASRRVAFQAAVTQPQAPALPTRASLEITLPAELRINNVLVMGGSDFIFDLTTDVKYAKNQDKTLTLVSKLRNIPEPQTNTVFSFFNLENEATPGYFNYSMELGVRHPETRTDVSVTSHVGRRGPRRSAGLGLAYLTHAMARQNLQLWAEIDQLKNALDLQVRTPTTASQLLGRVASTSPLRLELTTLTDGVPSLDAALTHDGQRAVLDLDIPTSGHALHLMAGRANATALTAHLDVTAAATATHSRDLAAALTLDTPRLLVSRLHWDCAALKQARLTFTSDLMTFLAGAKAGLRAQAREVADELTAKITAIQLSFREAAKPQLSSLTRDLAALGDDLKALVELTLPEQPPAYAAFLVTSSVGQQGYDSAVAEVRDMLAAYYVLVDHVAEALAAGLREVTEVTLGQEARKQVLGKFEDSLKVLDTLSTRLYMAGEELLEYIDSVKAAIAYLKENPTLENAKSTLTALRHVNYESLLTQLQTAVTERAAYKAVIGLLAQSPALARAAVAPLPRPARRTIDRAAAALYQQATWTWSYWDVPATLKQRLHQVLTLIQAVAEDEARQALKALSPVRAFTLHDGEFVLGVALPAPARRLDGAAAAAQIASLRQTATDVIADLHAATKIVEPIFFKANHSKVTHVA